MLKKKQQIYQGRSVKRFNEIRDILDIYHVKYTYQVKDTVNDTGSDSPLSFLGRQQGMAPRAFTGSAGVAAEDLKNYCIYAVEKEVKTKVPGYIFLKRSGTLFKVSYKNSFFRRKNMILTIDEYPNYGIII
ncbi:MAG: hypothetical protein ACLSX0_03260 [Anaerostipes caccae]